MTRLVLLKEGDYRPNVFTDFVETINNPLTASDATQVDFYVRSDYSFRLYANNVSNVDGELAVAHYNVNPTLTVQDPLLYRGVDVDRMCRALDEYNAVMFGVPTGLAAISDLNMLVNARYIVRDNTGRIIDYDSKEEITSDNNTPVQILTFLGMVKAGNMPVYYLIADPNILRLGNGLEFTHTATDTAFRKITDQDGSIRDNVFVPTLPLTAKFIGKNNIVTTSNVVEITFFQTVLSLMHKLEYTLSMQDVSVDTNGSWHLENNTIYIDVADVNTGYAEIRFNLGPFFTHAQEQEQPTFSYIIHKL